MSESTAIIFARAERRFIQPRSVTLFGEPIAPIRPMMDYAFPAWRSAARSHVRRLQVLQCKCIRLATGASWYLSNRRIHEDLGVPLFAQHIIDLTESLDSKLADVGNPLIRQLGSYFH